ncbi:putative 3'-5' exonuclease [Paratrimastix pyriformis]|uniref:3'-5' exonuclease n=1 Tax=Paratrimastix pyriformis TaxID=342808 RepID=A0ABQ8ULK4_9EUKA|nr:putative 3'-5' exonuclease [Paratrimastix pyriformis]
MAVPRVVPLLISRADECTQAIAKIYRTCQNKTIAFDSEGVRLSRTGPICLCQVATASNCVYLFDVSTGGASLFDAGLRRLLEDTAITKCMHDCRADSDALFHQFQVNLSNVYDTQLAYAMLQSQTHDGRFPLPIGLKRLLELHGYSNPYKEQVVQLMDSDRQIWARRPIQETLLQYASYDVANLMDVKAQQEPEMTSPILLAEFRARCRRYLDQYRKHPTEFKHATAQYGWHDWDSRRW